MTDRDGGMARRDYLVAIGIAVFAALLMTLAMGAMVSLGVHAGEQMRADSSSVTIRPASVVPSGSATSVPVLCYHYVRGPGSPFQFARVFGYVVLSLPLLDESELWKVSERGFEQQIYYLVSRGYHTVSLSDVHEWQMGRRDLPAKSIVLTFDDGDESVYELVYPVLKRYGLRATLFVVTSRVGTHWNGIQCLDWDRLRAMQRSGVFDIESHTHDLHYKVESCGNPLPVFVAASECSAPLPGDTRWENALFDDLTRSRLEIERHIGRSPEFLAWPYGFGNPAVDRIANEAGYLRTCALRARPSLPLAFGTSLILSDTERFEMPRYTITARTSLRAFRQMLEGDYHPDS